MGRCGLGGVKGHIKAFEKVKQGGAPCKIDAGGNSAYSPSIIIIIIIIHLAGPKAQYILSSPRLSHNVILILL